MDSFFNDTIEKAWENNNYVDACNDIEYIRRYIDMRSILIHVQEIPQARKNRFAILRKSLRNTNSERS